MSREIDSCENIYSKDIVDFETAKQYLFTNFLDSEKKLFGRELGINRTRAWLESLDNPQEQVPAIHIAGTSGKGSVAYMVTSLLKGSGSKIGTITSPHVYDVRERMLVDGGYITEDSFVNRSVALASAVDSFAKTDYGRPTYFELMLGFAHSQFVDEAVDYSVVETGIGGTYDSTNTINRSDKLAVITRLGLDHTEILGDTLPKIADQKGGIIPQNGHAIILEPEDIQTKTILDGIAEDKQASITYINPEQSITNIKQTTRGVEFDYKMSSRQIKGIRLPLLGMYQAENACLALETFAYLSQRDGIMMSNDEMKRALLNLKIPARAEISSIDGHPIIIDGAHNLQKLDAFFDLLDSLELSNKPLIIFASKNDKDWVSFSPRLARSAHKIYATSFFSQQPGHLSSKAEDPGKIASKLSQLGGLANSFKNPLEALNSALADALPNQAVVITGSIYMIGELHDQLVALAD